MTLKGRIFSKYEPIRTQYEPEYEPPSTLGRFVLHNPPAGAAAPPAPLTRYGGRALRSQRHLPCLPFVLKGIDRGVQHSPA